jgi:hypothetical protein
MSQVASVRMVNFGGANELARALFPWAPAFAAGEAAMHARSLCTAAGARAFSSVAPSSLRVCWHLNIPHLGDYADFCAGLYALRYVAGVTVR